MQARRRGLNPHKLIEASTDTVCPLTAPTFSLLPPRFVFFVLKYNISAALTGCRGLLNKPVVPGTRNMSQSVMLNQVTVTFIAQRIGQFTTGRGPEGLLLFMGTT